jgi:acylphosphatase
MMFTTSGLRGSAGGRTMAKKEAVEATVTGNDQQVGFRALVMKQAIEYNLAGSARRCRRNCSLYSARRQTSDRFGARDNSRRTKRSSHIKITTTSAAIDPALNAFTIVDWTSSSRNITNKYNLVFELRANDTAISLTDAKAVWHQILEKTLNADDLKKLQPDD